MSDWSDDIGEEASAQVTGFLEVLAGLLLERRAPRERFWDDEEDREGFVHRVRQALPKSIVFQDILEDIQDFAVLSSISDEFGEFHPSVRFGENHVPLLPARGMMKVIARTVWRYYPYPIRREIVRDWFAAGFSRGSGLKIEERSANESTGDFLKGLNLFMTARVAGTEWLTRIGVAAYSSRNTPAIHSPSGQWWTVQSQAAGLSIHCAGTHAVRVPAHYLAGVTTVSVASSQPQLPVFLPMGTIYLAGDAGPGGTLVWDDKTIVTVPSVNTLFATKSF